MEVMKKLSENVEMSKEATKPEKCALSYRYLRSAASEFHLQYNLGPELKRKFETEYVQRSSDFLQMALKHAREALKNLKPNNTEQILLYLQQVCICIGCVFNDNILKIGGSSEKIQQIAITEIENIMNEYIYENKILVEYLQKLFKPSGRISAKQKQENLLVLRNVFDLINIEKLFSLQTNFYNSDLKNFIDPLFKTVNLSGTKFQCNPDVI
eukprot:UN26562